MMNCNISSTHYFHIFHVRVQKMELACTLGNTDFFFSINNRCFVHSAQFCAVCFGATLCGATLRSQWKRTSTIDRTVIADYT